jgi:hypothetical protein
VRKDRPDAEAFGKLTREAALFLAVYGRPPSDFDKETAMGLAQNIPMIEARRTLEMAKAISVAFGSAETAQQTIYLATGNADLAFRARMQMEHEKAVSR